MSTTNCCCNSTDERNIKLDQILENHKSTKGALIPVLHAIQELYGYLPENAIQEVSKYYDIPLSEIFGVTTFYSYFSLNPKGKHVISVCMGTACYVKGSGQILDKLREELGIEVGDSTEDGNFSLEACRCLGACGLAPVIKVNEHVHGKLTTDDIKNVIAKYK